MTSKRILVVDDQPHVNRLLKRSLTQKGYEVDSASNGLDALELLRQHSFDAMVTDFQMPRMDGVTLCDTYIREKPDNKMLMILSTAVADENLFEWASRKDNTIYLEKPVSFKRLADILDTYFEGKE